ncbi:MAG: HEAT repeat domain-containing protein [Polyangiaceae bacterium]|nr:HEAT repeat domain-containing protein [Polyangiaceae bacterium]
MLLAWVEEGGACAPLAARALASRDDEAYRGILQRLLHGGSPQLRSHVALGLGRSPNADAAGRLADAYTFETEPLVRRALLRALSWRQEPQRNAVLRLAASLDPDATARAIAQGALRGFRAPEQAIGDLVAWLRVEGVTEAMALRWERPDGLVLPVVTDPDGTLLVPGLPTSPSHAVLPPKP